MASYRPRSRGPSVSGKLENRLCWAVETGEGRPFNYLEKNNVLGICFFKAKLLRECYALMLKGILI